MANERNTETIVRDYFDKGLGYTATGPDVFFGERSIEVEINRLLANASKSNPVLSGEKGHLGLPDFILTSPLNPDYVVVVECKADTKYHESADRDQTVKYAVDGALHYARYLAPKRHVIAIAVSGENTETVRYSTFIHPLGKEKPHELKSPDEESLSGLYTWQEYVQFASHDPKVEIIEIDKLKGFASKLHKFMREYGKVSESEKPLLVAGTLLALKDNGFLNGYMFHKIDELQEEWMRAIGRVLNTDDLPHEKVENMSAPYASLAAHSELRKKTQKYPNGILREIIDMLNENVMPLAKVVNGFDIIGQFYGEFLKYSGGDGKGLGIVLTPRHITELFCKLANLNKTDVVLDPCCGTGGFLISAMKHMLKKAKSPEEENNIKQNQLIGIENQPGMFALCASNMILRGDGKANLYQGSCLDDDRRNIMLEKNVNVGFINPPYSQKGEGLSELAFINNMLNMMVVGGMGIAIVPVSCATSPSREKEDLLKNHTLEAVMSMPTELFYPIGVVTCIMVWTARKPHGESNKDTWFGYWKEDGFTKTKNKGRVDLDSKWDELRDGWVSAFKNHTVTSGSSVMKSVTAKDEWIAEAYMETDYTTLAESDFEKVLREFVTFKVSTTVSNGISEADSE